MKDLLVTLMSIVLGIYLFEWMTNQVYMEAFQNSYWAVFGGLVVFWHHRPKSEDKG